MATGELVGRDEESEVIDSLVGHTRHLIAAEV
jgi:hypothetical protein